MYKLYVLLNTYIHMRVLLIFLYLMIAPKPLLSCQFQEGKFEIFEKNSIGGAIARQFFSFVENAVNVVGTDLDPLNQSPFTSNAEGTEGLATAKSIVFTCVRKFSKSNISFYVLQMCCFYTHA